MEGTPNSVWRVLQNSVHISAKKVDMPSGRFSRSSITMTPSKMIAVFEASKCSACGGILAIFWYHSQYPDGNLGCVTFTVLIKKKEQQYYNSCYIINGKSHKSICHLKNQDHLLGHVLRTTNKNCC